MLSSSTFCKHRRPVEEALIAAHARRRRRCAMLRVRASSTKRFHRLDPPRIGQRPHHWSTASKPSPMRDRIGLFGRFCDEAVVNQFMHEEPRRRGADLPAVTILRGRRPPCAAASDRHRRISPPARGHQAPASSASWSCTAMPASSLPIWVEPVKVMPRMIGELDQLAAEIAADRRTRR